jgi:AmpD protein
MRVVDSPNQDERPPGTEITLVVLHSISLPPGEFGGDAIERLFTNRLDPTAHPYFKEVHGLRVSAHFLIRRDGELVRFVPIERRAWHAGPSSWRGRSRCNDFSVGIELEGTDAAPFEDAQYARLHELLVGLRRLLPLRQIAAHSEIAPGRKTDPGPGFDWRRLLLDLGTSSV